MLRKLQSPVGLELIEQKIVLLDMLKHISGAGSYRALQVIAKNFNFMLCFLGDHWNVLSRTQSEKINPVIK